MLQDAFPFPVGIRYAAYCRNQNGQNDNQYSDVPAYQCRRDGADDAAYFFRAEFNAFVGHVWSF